MELSTRALEITESLTLAIDGKAKKMRAEGFDVISFGAGEPDFKTPEYIINAAKEALDKGFTKYTPASGMLELKKAITKKLKRDNGLDYDESQVIISNGAKHSLSNIFQAIINPGDEVIIPMPYWNSYPEMVKLAGGIPVLVKTSEHNDFKVTLQDLANAISDKTKAFILNSPSNPNGTIYNEDELWAIGRLALQKKFYIISDEIYEKLIYDGNKHISIASLDKDIKDITITVNGMSKAYAMTGWRIGYTVGPENVIKAMSNIQSHFTSNPNSIAQYASIAALESVEDEVDSMVKEFSERRMFMVDRINSINNLSCRKPQGAFYVMMNISKVLGKKHNGVLIDGSLTFTDALLNSKMVTVVPGIAFGADSYVRLSYANSMDNIKKGLSKIEEFVNELE